MPQQTAKVEIYFVRILKPGGRLILDGEKIVCVKSNGGKWNDCVTVATGLTFD